MVIQSGFFRHIYQKGCTFNLHSIINHGLILGGQNSSKRQTVFFLPIDPRDTRHKDREKIDFSVPRRAQYLHSAWKKHQDAVHWVDIGLAIWKGLTFYQTRSNAIILQGTLPACCMSKVVRLKTGEVLYETSYMSLRLPSKISLRHDWTRIWFKSCSTTTRRSCSTTSRRSCSTATRRSFSTSNILPTNPPIPKPICDRSGQPDNKHEVFVDKGETSWSREIKEKFSPWSREINETTSHEELCSSDRSGQLDITPSVIKAQTNMSGEIQVEQTHDRSGQPDNHEIAQRAAPEVHREITTLNTQ